MKNLLLAFIIMFASSAFAQDLNDWQQKKVDKEMAEMNQVMDLSAKQTKKMLKLKTSQALDATKISSSTQTGTPESKEAWQAHGQKFNAKAKAIVSDEQWKKWTAHNRAKRNNKTAGKKNNTAKKTAKKKSAQPKLSAKAMEKVNKDVAEMTKAMKLTPVQVEAVRDIKIQYSADAQKLYRSTEKGPERTAAFRELTKASNKQIRIATSSEQMNAWWKYWEENKK